MLVRIFLSTAICLSGIVSQAQILRVDKSHLESDSAGYLALYTDAFFSLDNRSLSPQKQMLYTRLYSKADLLYVSENHAYILINSVEYVSTSNAQPFSTGYTHFRVNFRRKHRVSYEMYSQVQYDEIRRMRLRALTGGGIRLTAVDKDGFDVHLGSGVMYEIEKWRAAEGDQAKDFYKRIPKLANYLGVEFELSKYVKLNLWGLYETGYDLMESIQRNRYAGEATLNFIVSRRVTWMNRFAYFYDVHPIVPINQAFYQISNGLRLNF